ncbi:hypothetical protein [Peribacillus sp. R9-11]|uniref:hypothetical protein n=1 Tax=Peribacillus sp. R9-11 TaxID=3073271 RepID=UPI0028697BEB|nr:hypothetical protein [Peribacillus sp. R9-11]WMX54271.1 hypothetical protein RE409_19645 [Peribacillus sp. R9-11]
MKNEYLRRNYMSDFFKPAIVAIGYNRPDSMQRLLNSIGRSNFHDKDITLVISIDNCEKTQEVVEVAEAFSWEHGNKIIRTFETRQGLRNHILQCGDLSQKYGAVIILEDDLVVSPTFYSYTQAALNYYKDNDELAGIALYSHQWNGYAQRFFFPVSEGNDVYFAQFGVSWGQCWSEKQWSSFRSWYESNQSKLEYTDEIPNQITNWPETSWGKYFVYYMVEKNKYYIMSYNALATNFTEVGQHAKSSDNTYQVPLLYGEKDFKFVSYETSVKYDIFFERQEMEKYFPVEILKGGVCVDLYATKEGYGNNRYLLTTSSKPYKIIKSYGLQMRPQELNIIYNVAGNDIFLYDMETVDKTQNLKNKYNYSLFKYDVRGLTWRQALIFGVNEFIKTFKRRFSLKQ